MCKSDPHVIINQEDINNGITIIKNYKNINGILSKVPVRCKYLVNHKITHSVYHLTSPSLSTLPLSLTSRTERSYRGAKSFHTRISITIIFKYELLQKTYV